MRQAGRLLFTTGENDAAANKNPAEVSKKVKKVPLTFTDLTSKTKGQIENYFEILKNDDFRSKGQYRADGFCEGAVWILVKQNTYVCR